MNSPAKPRTVIVETSTRFGEIALAECDQLIGVRPLDEARRHARDLAPHLHDLLQQQGWRPRDVELVIANIGPGSYTGLRVGLMSAKTFAYAADCALIAVDAMSAVALQAPAEVQRLDVFVDAQQDRVYFRRFQRDATNDIISRQCELRIIQFDKWLADEEKALWVSGPGLQGKEDRLPKDVKAAEVAQRVPRAGSLLTLGLRRFHAGERDNPWTLEPLYLRPSAAEEQWDRK